MPAGAHDDAGQMTVEVDGTDDPGRVRVRARVVYSNDFEPAPAATVAADAIAADGSVGATAPLAYDADGVYAGELALPGPGAWTVRVTATNPAATGDAAYTAPPPTTTPSTSPGTTRAPTASTKLTGEQSGADVGDSDDTPVGVLVAVGVAFAVLTAVWLFLRTRSRSGGRSAGD